MIMDRNDGEGNCLNQMVGILEEYASQSFSDALARGPITEVFNLEEQSLCFQDFYDAVIDYAERLGVDATLLVTFRTALISFMDRQAFVRGDELGLLESAEWQAIRRASLAPLALLQTFPKYSREWCDAMRANRMDPAGIIPADGFRVPDGFFDEDDDDGKADR